MRALVLHPIRRERKPKTDTTYYDAYISDSIKQIRQTGKCFCHTEEQITEISKGIEITYEWIEQYEIYEVRRKKE